MADYETQVFPTGGYQATHKGWNHHTHVTPNWEVKEGQRFGQFYPAPYLPTVRLEKAWEDYVVIGGGKAVALDSSGWLVPAGFKLLLALGAGNGPQYTATDVQMGIKNAQGNTPLVGEYVVDSMIAGSVTVGHCLGAASYDVYLLSGSDPTNPATYLFHNYNRQTGVAVLTDYLLEFPVEPLKRTKKCLPLVTVTGPIANPYRVNLAESTVLSTSVTVELNGAKISASDVTFQDNAGPAGVDRIELSAALQATLAVDDEIKVCYTYEESFYQAPFMGIASWKGAAKHGDKVTFDVDSNWVAYTPGVVGDTSLADESASITAAIALTLDVVGQVTKVDKHFPKQALDRVKTAFDSRLTGSIVDGVTGLEMELDKLPGSATDGMPSNVFMAGGAADTGIVQFNLNVT
jgi:hypothetical protein